VVARADRRAVTNRPRRMTRKRRNDAACEDQAGVPRPSASTLLSRTDRPWGGKLKPFFSDGGVAGTIAPANTSSAESRHDASPSARREGRGRATSPTGSSSTTGQDRSRPSGRLAVTQAGRFRPEEHARIAVYDAKGSAPRVEEVEPASAGEFISLLASRTYELSRQMGGKVPYSVINEVVENYIHADFRGPVVSILDAGNTIRFSDRGPGIRDKQKAVEPGYTTASADMKRYIRGVGSGLPLVRDCLSFNAGSVRIEDNLGSGTVITVSVGPSSRRPSERHEAVLPSAALVRSLASAASPVDRSPSSTTGALLADESGPRRATEDSEVSGADFELEIASEISPGTPRLTNRQKRVLALVMEAGEAGPSLVAKELAIGLSTAYRDLAHLEMLGLITADGSGKRSLTDEGASFLHGLLHPGR
jgi:hypothetical protein